MLFLLSEINFVRISRAKLTTMKCQCEKFSWELLSLMFSVSFLSAKVPPSLFYDNFIILLINICLLGEEISHKDGTNSVGR
jgi:hypothetical protein